MKAITYHNYGSSEQLQLEEFDMPTAKSNEVLIQVYATSVNDWDLGLLLGKPWINRNSTGIFKPTKIQSLGSDVAGKVVAIGNDISVFQVGDEVFGDLCENGFGGFAEYVCTKESSLMHKPDFMSFEQAAATTQAGLLALQGLTNRGGIQKGNQVLINGAGGGAGSFAIQIAKSMGAEVTAVDSAEKLELMQHLGADHVIDYHKEDFTKNGIQYDRILDCAAHHSYFDYRRALQPKGIYSMLGGATGKILQILFLGLGLFFTTKKTFHIVIYRPNKGLDSLVKLIQKGSVVPTIDRLFPLKEAADAMKCFENAHAKGKIIISVQSNSNHK